MKKFSVPIKYKRDDVALFFWSAAVFSYFFQFPFSFLSYLIIPCMICFLLLKLSKGLDRKAKPGWLLLFIVYLGDLLLMAAISVVKAAPIANIIRFLLILSAIPLFCILKYDPAFKKEVNVFMALAVVKCLLLLFFAFLVIAMGSHETLRNWVQREQLGDIYIDVGTHVPRVQVQGNGILPMAYFIHLYLPKRNKRLWYFYTAALLMGVLTAGNSAFMLALGIYYFVFATKYILVSDASPTRKFICLILLFMAGMVGLLYIVSQLSIKALYSNAVRLLQARTLLQTNVLIGNGLGSYINATALKSYEGAVYFELQTLYIFNQIGLLGLGGFYALLFSRIAKNGAVALFLFIIYLAYSFWNPYCFDTTEMIVVFLLLGNSMEKRKTSKELALMARQRERQRIVLSES